jgi:3-oxoacyl-[acyl-carrier protein] reductase
MDLGIKGKNALVTGGTRGLGLAAVTSLAKEGVNVIFCARNQESLDETSKLMSKLGANFSGLKVEITNDEKKLNEFFLLAESKFGDINILINNVGGSLGSGSLINDTLENYEKVFDINFWASLKLMKIAIQKMSENKWGRIINISSIFGREYGGNSSSYMASKASLIASTKHLAIECASKGITVNSIAPGSIKHKGGSWEKFVNLNEKSVVDEFISNNLPMGKFGSPEPVGDMIAFLSSKLAFTVTGTCINIDGGQGSSLI